MRKKASALFFIAFVTLCICRLLHVVTVQADSACGLTNPAFCDTFDQPMGVAGGKTGQLNPVVWGVSRLSSSINPGQGGFMDFAPSHNVACGGQLVQPDNDILICNGHLTESVYDWGNDTVLAMYPKQPFDFAGRTGKVTFDVSNDSQGVHAAWPEFWMTDKPTPAPVGEEPPGLGALPANGFGLRFGGCQTANVGGTVDSAVIVRNYMASDSFMSPGSVNFSCDQSIVQASGLGQMNHYEIDVSQNQIDVYATDAFAGILNLSATPLKHIATVSNANLPFTRGLIWITDVHYNACKFNTQCEHTFAWDNVGFDGPVLPRDIGYEVPDAQVVNSDGSVRLGRISGTPVSLNIDPTALNAAAAELLEFNFYPTAAPISLSYSLNGHPTHTLAWPYPDSAAYTFRTIAIPVPASELQAGSNLITINAGDVISNIDLIMVAAGGLPNCIDPSSCSVGTATPQPTATRTPSPTATMTAPTPNPAQAGHGTLGTTTIGSITDTCDAGFIDGSQITTNSPVNISSISAYVVSPLSSSPKFQVAIYSDASGTPGSLIAHSASVPLKANTWNSAPVRASLSANTSYWLMYQASGSKCTVNNMRMSSTSNISGAWSQSPFPFGVWPSATTWNLVADSWSIYASY